MRDRELILIAQCGQFNPTHWAAFVRCSDKILEVNLGVLSPNCELVGLRKNINTSNKLPMEVNLESFSARCNFQNIGVYWRNSFYIAAIRSVVYSSEAVLAVPGIDANEELEAVYQAEVDYWLDSHGLNTTDI